MRTVLEIIPRSMFVTLNQIVEFQTSRLAPVPTRFEREKMKECVLCRLFHCVLNVWLCLAVCASLTTPPPLKSVIRVYSFAQVDERHLLAKLTHDVSVFAEGIRSMQTTLVGVVQVQPQQLLEEGIRRVRALSTAVCCCVVLCGAVCGAVWCFVLLCGVCV